MKIRPCSLKYPLALFYHWRYFTDKSQHIAPQYVLLAPVPLSFSTFPLPQMHLSLPFSMLYFPMQLCPYIFLGKNHQDSQHKDLQYNRISSSEIALMFFLILDVLFYYFIINILFLSKENQQWYQNCREKKEKRKNHYDQI